MSTIDEKIFFFSGSKKRMLLGFLHLPTSTVRRTGIIFCHPFADEENLSHRVIVETARAFARQGFPVLRFDMSGCGDSEGELGDVTIDDWIEDIKEAIAVYKMETKLNHYILWGLRLGAGLALVYAARYGAVCPLILWQPVINFSDYIKKFFRKKFTTQISDVSGGRFSVSKLINELYDQGIVCIIGYQITTKLYKSFIDVSQNHLMSVSDCPKLLLSISLMEYPSILMKRYADLLKTQKSPFQFQHVTTESFWDRYWRWKCPEVQAATMKWLEKMF
jgi:exosortase A-associated hydrolase 2